LRCERIEGRRCPKEHSLAAILRKSDELRYDRQRKITRKLVNDFDIALSSQPPNPLIDELAQATPQ
jgi:hypothetical protein